MARPSKRCLLCLVGTGLIVLVAPQVQAQTLQEAACYLFEGKEDCRTVAVVDEANCVIKIRSPEFAELDPSIAGCLIDEIGTSKLNLKDLRPESLSMPGESGPSDTRSTARIIGSGVLHLLARYDEKTGAPVWQPQDSYTFELEGDPGRTRQAFAQITSRLCAVGAALTAGGDAVPRTIGAKEAFRLADEGRIVLIDIRSEAEWRKTGLAASAVPITIHQSMKRFVSQLDEAAGADHRTPIALICDSGVRSAYLQRELRRYGYSDVIDVHEGMSGGPQGPGWIRSGLPMKPYAPAQPKD